MVTVVVSAWVVFYAVALATAEQPTEAVTAVAQLVVPPLLGVALLQIGSVVVAAWRARSGPGSVRPHWTRPGGCSPPRWRRCPCVGATGVAR